MGTVPTDFSGRDVAKVLRKANYDILSRTGSHVKFGKDVEGEANRRVTVPMKNRIPTGTLRSIAEQAGANDFENFCRWVDENR
jgi:predicted RNA binding protein YcfA (HicA-like mRNA interferase family)